MEERDLTVEEARKRGREFFNAIVDRDEEAVCSLLPYVDVQTRVSAFVAMVEAGNFRPSLVALVVANCDVKHLFAFSCFHNYKKALDYLMPKIEKEHLNWFLTGGCAQLVQELKESKSTI